MYVFPVAAHLLRRILEEKKLFYLVEWEPERGNMPLVRTIKKRNELSQLWHFLKILDAKLSRFPLKKLKGMREVKGLLYSRGD